MEDTLRDVKIVRTPDWRGVLILVLMEDTLRDGERILDAAGNPVLILVLMEDTLRAAKTQTLKTSTRQS